VHARQKQAQVRGKTMQTMEELHCHPLLESPTGVRAEDDDADEVPPLSNQKVRIEIDNEG